MEVCCRLEEKALHRKGGWLDSPFDRAEALRRHRVDAPDGVHLARVVAQVASGSETDFEHLAPRLATVSGLRSIHEPHGEVLSPGLDAIAKLHALLEQRQVLAVAFFGEVFLGDEAQRRAVDAVALTGGCRAVVEDVAEVAVAVLAADFGAARHQLSVDVLADVLLVDRLGEARPSGAAVVLVRGAEEWLAAHHVDVDAVFLVVPELVAERRLGAFFLGDRVLQRRQLLRSSSSAGLSYRLLLSDIGLFLLLVFRAASSGRLPQTDLRNPSRPDPAR